MKNVLIFATAAMVMAASPASAQLLGGSGGGMLGGVANGPLGGSAGSVGGAGGVLRAEGSIRGSRNVDTRSGRAEANRSAGGALGGVLNGSAGGTTASGSGTASASKNASIGFQAIGTDGIGGAVNGALNAAGSAAASLNGAGGGVLGSSPGGNSSSNDLANGSGSFGSGLLAAAGSAAANAAGAFAVTRGMVVDDARGRAIGRVEEVRAAANGAVDTVIIQIRDREVALPAGNFSVSGDGLVSAMSRAEVRKEAARQNDPS